MARYSTRCFGILLAAAIVFACGSRAEAQESMPLESLSSQPSEETPAPAASQPAEDFGSLLLERPAVPLTTPRFVVKPKVKPEEPFDEGTMLIARRCRLDKDSSTNWYSLRLEGDTDPRPKRVAPSLLLEQMIALDAAQKGRMFRVNCETAIYKGNVYLVLRRLSVETDAPAEPTPSAPAVTEKSSPTTAQASASVETASRPAPKSNLAAKLLRERPAKPVLIPVAPSHEGEIAGDSIAPGEQSQVSPGRGSMVVDRLVRVVVDPGGSWKMVRFESDNTLQEPPIRLIPSRQLERAEMFLSPRSRYHKLVVSGELLEFQGRRYLLLRKVLPFREMGQF